MPISARRGPARSAGIKLDDAQQHRPERADGDQLRADRVGAIPGRTASAPSERRLLEQQPVIIGSDARRAPAADAAWTRTSISGRAATPNAADTSSRTAITVGTPWASRLGEPAWHRTTTSTAPSAMTTTPSRRVDARRGEKRRRERGHGEPGGQHQCQPRPTMLGCRRAGTEVVAPPAWVRRRAGRNRTSEAGTSRARRRRRQLPQGVDAPPGWGRGVTGVIQAAANGGEDLAQRRVRAAWATSTIRAVSMLMSRGPRRTRSWWARVPR